MEQMTNQLMTTGTLLLAVTIVIATFFVRRAVELARPGWKKQAHELAAKPTYLGQAGLWWNDFVLPLMPVLFGLVAAFTSSELLFGPLAGERLFIRFMWGGGIGWFSGVLYGGVAKAVKARTGIDITPAGPAVDIPVVEDPVVEDKPEDKPAA